MSTYRENTAEPVRDAVKWAAESASRTLNTYVDMVEHSRSGTYTSEQMAKDVAAISLGMQQDAARIVTTWSRLFTGLAD